MRPEAWPALQSLPGQLRPSNSGLKILVSAATAGWKLSATLEAPHRRTSPIDGAPFEDLFTLARSALIRPARSGRRRPRRRKAAFRSVDGTVCAIIPDDPACLVVADAFHPRIRASDETSSPATAWS